MAGDGFSVVVLVSAGVTGAAVEGVLIDVVDKGRVREGSVSEGVVVTGSGSTGSPGASASNESGSFADCGSDLLKDTTPDKSISLSFPCLLACDPTVAELSP